MGLQNDDVISEVLSMSSSISLDSSNDSRVIDMPMN